MATKSLTDPEIRELKAVAQHLEPVVRVGKGALSADYLSQLRR